MKIISVCLILFLSILPLNIKVLAQEATGGAQVTGGQIDEALQKTVPVRFLPGHPFYFLITLKEAVTRFFKPSSAEKAEFDFILSGKRLKETHLLLENNQRDKAKENLDKYSSRLAKMSKMIDKARAQNQDIASIVGLISDGLQYHEILLVSFLDKKGKLDLNLNLAISAFRDTVLQVDKIKPGLKDRYQILEIESESEKKSREESTPSSTFKDLLDEASPSARPRRIIY